MRLGPFHAECRATIKTWREVSLKINDDVIQSVRAPDLRRIEDKIRFQQLGNWGACLYSVAVPASRMITSAISRGAFRLSLQTAMRVTAIATPVRFTDISYARLGVLMFRLQRSDKRILGLDGENRETRPKPEPDRVFHSHDSLRSWRTLRSRRLSLATRQADS
jgi:hypothetical protein